MLFEAGSWGSQAIIGGHFRVIYHKTELTKSSLGDNDRFEHERILGAQAAFMLIRLGAKLNTLARQTKIKSIHTLSRSATLPKTNVFQPQLRSSDQPSLPRDVANPLKTNPQQCLPIQAGFDFMNVPTSLYELEYPRILQVSSLGVEVLEQCGALSGSILRI